MDFIATHWWIWLIGMFVCYAYAGYNQVQRMNAVSNGDIDNIFKGVLPMFLAGLSGSVFSIVLLLSIVINLIDYFKQ